MCSPEIAKCLEAADAVGRAHPPLTPLCVMNIPRALPALAHSNVLQITRLPVVFNNCAFFLYTNPDKHNNEAKHREQCSYAMWFLMFVAVEYSL